MRNKIVKETKIKVKSGTLFTGEIISETETFIKFKGTGWVGEDNMITIDKSFIIQIDGKPYPSLSNSRKEIAPSFYILTEAFEGTGHTVLSFDILFKEDLTNTNKQIIEAKLPQPFKRYRNWVTDNIFHFSTQEWYDMNIRISYNKKIAAYFNKNGIDVFDENKHDVFIKNSFDDAATEIERTAFNNDIMKFLELSNAIVPIALVYTTDIINHPKFQRYLKKSITHFSNNGILFLSNLWSKADSWNSDQVMDLANLSLDVLSAYVRELRSMNPADSEKLLQLVYSINKISPDESWDRLSKDIKGK